MSPQGRICGLTLCALLVGCGARAGIGLAGSGDTEPPDASPPQVDTSALPCGDQHCNGNPPCNTRIAVIDGKAWRLAASEGYVYWITGDEVGRVPRCGGAEQIIAQDQPRPFRLAVEHGSVCWLDVGLANGMNQVVCRHNGQTLIPASGEGLDGVALRGDTVYWGTSSPVGIHKRTFGGDEVELGVAAQNDPTESVTIVADDSHVYAATESYVYAVSIAGGAMKRIFDHGGHDFIGDKDNLYLESYGSIWKIPKNGLPPTMIHYEPSSSGGELAQDSDSIYNCWGVRIGKDGQAEGGAYVDLNGYSIAADDSYVYGEADDGWLDRAPKD